VLTLRRGEERRLAAGHPWVFSNEIDTERTPLTAFTPGALAELRSDRGAFMGHAYVNPHALICARILSRDAAQPVDRALIERRLVAALALRRRLNPASYYR
jgi:23S rRNA (cytosine1962-C5)-methyltransferase